MTKQIISLSENAAKKIKEIMSAAEKNSEEDTNPTDQIATGSISILFPDSKLKLYLEFGRNDHAWDIYDLRAMPNHSSASQIGFRKIEFSNE